MTHDRVMGSLRNSILRLGNHPKYLCVKDSSSRAIKLLDDQELRILCSTRPLPYLDR